LKKPIINIKDVELKPLPVGFAPSGEAAHRYDTKMGAIAPLLGALKLGYNVTSVPPGKQSFPFHNHQVNEEMFFILNGTGEVRIGGSQYPVKKHDIIACPPGGSDLAHQIINTGESDLVYLAVSTKISPEIAEYPDSDKFGVMAVLPPDKDGKPQRFTYVGRLSDNHDYWEGE